MPRKIGTLLFSKKIVLLDEVCLEHDKVFSQHFQKSFVKSSITISQTPRRFFAKTQKIVRFHRRKKFFKHTHHTDDNVTVFFLALYTISGLLVESFPRIFLLILINHDANHYTNDTS